MGDKPPDNARLKTGVFFNIGGVKTPFGAEAAGA